MEACNPNAQNIEVYINFQYLCDHFDEYGISLKTPEADTSDSNEEGLIALKIKVVEKVVEHFEEDTHSVSPIRIDGVVGTHSRILTFLHDLEKLGNVLFNESKILIKVTDGELVDITSMQQIYDQAVVFVVYNSNEDYSSDIDTDSNASGDTLILSDNDD